MRRIDLLLLSAVFVFLSKPAFAYLDLPTVSMALQALLGSVAVGLVALKVYWQKIRDFFSRPKDQE